MRARSKVDERENSAAVFKIKSSRTSDTSIHYTPLVPVIEIDCKTFILNIIVTTYIQFSYHTYKKQKVYQYICRQISYIYCEMITVNFKQYF